MVTPSVLLRNCISKPREMQMEGSRYLYFFQDLFCGREQVKGFHFFPTDQRSSEPCSVFSTDDGENIIFKCFPHFLCILFFCNRSLILGHLSYFPNFFLIKNNRNGTSFVVQWPRFHTSNAGGLVFILGKGIGSHIETSLQICIASKDPSCLN